jgi:hypothetical protein
LPGRDSYRLAIRPLGQIQLKYKYVKMNYKIHLAGLEINPEYFPIHKLYLSLDVLIVAV